MNVKSCKCLFDTGLEKGMIVCGITLVVYTHLVIQGDVEFVRVSGSGGGGVVKFVEGVLEDAHLPNVLGRVGLVQQELANAQVRSLSQFDSIGL